MVKHTQKIRRKQPSVCLSVFDYSVGLAALKGLRRKEYSVFHIFKNSNSE